MTHKVYAEDLQSLFHTAQICGEPELWDFVLTGWLAGPGVEFVTPEEEATELRHRRIRLGLELSDETLEARAAVAAMLRGEQVATPFGMKPLTPEEFNPDERGTDAR